MTGRWGIPGSRADGRIESRKPLRAGAPLFARQGGGVMNEHEHVASSEYTDCDICRFAARLKDQFGRHLALCLTHHGSDDFEVRTHEARAALLDTLRTFSRLDPCLLQTLEEFTSMISRTANEVDRGQPPA